MKTRLKIKGCLAGVSLILVLAGMPAHAKEAGPSKVNYVDSIVVTAGKSESEQSKVPSGVSLLYGEDMEDSGARTVADYLHQVPGLHLDDVEGNGSQIMMTMRGMPTTNSEYILVLVDGIPQSVASSQVHWSAIPMNIVDKIEVVRGPGSALYGMSAMGGVINIITKSPSPEFSANIGTSLGSYGVNSQTVDFSGTKNKTGYLFSAKRYESEGWRERNNETLNYNLFGKLTHKLNEKIDLNLNLSFADWDNDWPDLIPKEDYDKGVRKKVYYESNEQGKKPEAALTLNYAATGNLRLTNRLYGQALDQKRKDIINIFHEEIDAFGVGDEIQAELNHSLWGRPNKFIAGVNFEYHKSEVTRQFSELFPRASRRGVRFREVESAKRVYAAYLHDVYDVTDALSLTAGLRFDYVDAEYEDILNQSGTQSNDFHHLSPKLGLAYKPMENLMLFASAGTGFKAPSTALMARTPDIKPEKLTSYEVGMKTTLFDRLSLQAVCYTSDFTDQIAEVQDPNEPSGFRKTNAGESEMKGLELEANYFIMDNLMVFGTYTHNRSTYSNFQDRETGILDGKTLALQPKNKVAAGIRYFHDSGFSASFSTKWVDEQYLSALNEYALPSYTVSDAKLAYRFDNGLTLSFTMNNIFDEDYPAYGYNWGGGDVSLTPAAPRTFLAQASFNF